MKALPSNWQSFRLEELCSFHRGLTYKKKDEVDLSKNGVLRANNVSLESGELDLTELRYIDDQINIPADKKVRKGSLLVCMASGSKKHLGKAALVDEDYGYAFGGFMGLLMPKAIVYPKYLYWITQSKGYSAYIMGLSDGANINNLKFSQLGQYQVSLPPLPEQKRIVAILDEAFAGIATAVANTEKNLANARELFKSAVDSVLGERGESWLEDRLENLCTGIFAGGDVPKMNYSKQQTERHRVPIYTNGEKNNGLYGYTEVARVTQPSLTISARGTIGFTQIRNEPFYPAIRLIVAIPDRARINLRFLYYAIRRMTIGHSGTSIPQLTAPMVRAFSIGYPSLFKQGEIAERLDSLHSETEDIHVIYERKLKALAELKQSLLQKAFSGELTAAPKDEIETALA